MFSTLAAFWRTRSFVAVPFASHQAYDKEAQEHFGGMTPGDFPLLRPWRTKGRRNQSVKFTRSRSGWSRPQEREMPQETEVPLSGIGSRFEIHPIAEKEGTGEVNDPGDMLSAPSLVIVQTQIKPGKVHNAKK